MMMITTTTNVVGIKFIVFTDPNRSSEELLLKKLYEIYSDFALKNPFYSLDMPIRYMLLSAAAHTVLCVSYVIIDEIIRAVQINN